MDLLIESWEWSLGLSVAFGILMFIGFKIGWLIGYIAVDGVKQGNAPSSANSNATFMMQQDVGTP